MKIMPPPHRPNTQGPSSSLLPPHEHDDDGDGEEKYNYVSDTSDSVLPATEPATPTHSPTRISSTTLKNIRISLHVFQDICIIILLSTWLWFKSYLRRHAIPVPATFSTLLPLTFLLLLLQALTTTPGSRLQIFEPGTAYGSTRDSPRQRRRRLLLLLLLPLLLSTALLFCWSFALADLAHVAGWWTVGLSLLQQQSHQQQQSHHQQQRNDNNNGGGGGGGGQVCAIVSWEDEATGWVAHGIYEVGVCRTFVMEFVLVGLEVVAAGGQLGVGVWEWWREG